jgi:hypothetical protein
LTPNSQFPHTIAASQRFVKIRVVACARQIIKFVTQFTKLPFFWKSIAHVAIVLNGSAARGDRFRITILQCKIGFDFFGAVPHSRFDWLAVSRNLAGSFRQSLFDDVRSE